MSVSKQVLVVEDSIAFSKILTMEIRKRGFGVKTAFSKKEAIEILNSGEKFFIAMLDLGLPDAMNGEIVDEVLAYDIPSIVLTGMFDPKIRQLMDNKPIVDFVLKQGVEDIHYAISILDRVWKNQNISVLVVDDSRSIRATISSYLSTQLYNVLEAENGKDALAILERYPEIKIVITDYEMPVMDGFEFVRAIRKKYKKEDLVIVAISSRQSLDISSKFLKFGSNDFLAKPFSKEEFISRINLNIGMVEAISDQKETSKKLQDINNALIKEQQVARKKQIRMVVNDFVDDERFIVKTFYKPSEILSGDAYSLHKTPDGGALIYIIDGMGHGLLPSFTAFSFANTVKIGLAEEGGSFADLLESLAATLRQSLSENEQLSFSIFYFDIEKKMLHYAIGGMYPSLLVDNSKLTKLKANNPPFMSFMPSISHSSQKCENFNKLLVYSDGLTEDRDFGLSEGAIEILLEGDSFEWVCEKLEEKKMEDDTTILYFEKIS